MEDLETIIMELLVNAGSARSAALTALQLARKGDFAAAEQAMAESHEFVKHAHKIQTQLIGLDEGSGKLPVNLITVHSQDHLMNAMVIQDLATDMIELYRRLPLAQYLSNLTGVAAGARPRLQKAVHRREYPAKHAGDANADEPGQDKAVVNHKAANMGGP